MIVFNPSGYFKIKIKPNNIVLMKALLCIYIFICFVNTKHCKNHQAQDYLEQSIASQNVVIMVDRYALFIVSCFYMCSL